VEAGGAEHARVVGHELALQARPRRIGAGPRVELRPRRVAEEVRHHPKDGCQLRPGSSGAGASPSGIAGDGDRSWEGEEGAMGSGAEAAGRVRKAQWGAEQRGRMLGVWGGPEPCTVNAYTVVLSSSRDKKIIMSCVL
jgi:hypothetical protein